MWFCRSELLASSHLLATHQERSSLNGIHPINSNLIKLRKLLELRGSVLLYYPDFNKPVHFHLYTDASYYQLEAVIMKDIKLIAFYSRKLNTAQKRCTTPERELLSAIETCKEYKNILLDYPIIVFIDHKNNTFNGFKTSHRIFHWLLLLEEYGVTFKYLPGKKNLGTVADALSRLNFDSLKIQEEEVFHWYGSPIFSGRVFNALV
jgi:hypothetical protein